MLPYRQVHIQCQTNDSIPPPYSHYYSLVVDENPSYLTLSFTLNYTEREDLTEEEILDEGFSPDDDFAWKGTLSKVWKLQLDAMLGETKLAAKPASGSDYVVEVKTDEGGNERTGYVSKKETLRWAYFIQELKQAILETERIEAPLKIEYLLIDGEKETLVVLNGIFAERNFTVRINDRPVEQLEWHVLQQTINLIFNETEIDQEQSLPRRPVKRGHYLNIPGAGWFEFDEGIRPRYQDASILENIKKTMRAFISGQ